MACFESRKADEMQRMIEKQAGVPFVSPSMREVALEQNPAAVDFAHRLITGGIDVAIFMTGVGFRHLLAQVERHVERERYLNALADIITIARGPKPVVAMKEVNLTPTVKVPEPNTWREVLQTIDAQVPIASQVVGVQEYGKANPSLIAGLEARGAQVINVPVYQYDFPEDSAPLAANIRAIAAGEREVAMFTSAHQVVNLLRMAEKLGLENELRTSFARMAIASVGPTTSEMLRELDLPVDIEPPHPKMGSLIITAAEEAADVIEKKRGGRSPARPRTLNRNEAEKSPWHDSLFMKACRGEPTEVTPVWLMRQAGRYMQEYRQVRGETTFLELCKNPQLCSEIMCTAVRKLGVDAAILFSDLLPILEPMGLDLEFSKGEGPVIHNPVREPADIDRIRELEDVSSLQFVFDAVRQTRLDLPEDLPLIGFAGAPFTLASYTIEGGSSRNYLFTKTLMYRDPGAWRTLMQKLSRSITRYLNAQIAAGCQAVQLFDSWVGCLGPDDYRQYVFPFVREIIAGITPGIPVIHFGTGNPELLPAMAEAGGDVVGVDWRIRLDDAWQRIGHDRAVQGNLDPLTLLASQDYLRAQVQNVLSQAGGRPGHIFNLGHGVLQQTPVENAIALVKMVHDLSAK